MLEKSELDRELLREIASIGGSYGARIEGYISEMKRIKRAVSYLKLRLKREKGTPIFSMRLLVRLRRRFYDLRERAIEQRRYLIIYREALGLLKHREVFEVFNVEDIRL